MDTSAVGSLGWDAWLTLAVVSGIFLSAVLTRLSTDVVFWGGTGLLMICGILDTKAALAGFSSPGVITVGVLYIIVSGLQETGALLWIYTRVMGHPATLRRAQSRLMFPVFILSGFLNNTPVVAMFIPVLMQWVRRLGRSASQFLIPLSYASILGGM
ncbi:SLC13 family permease [Tichowtungia aerotolerans]|uniref:SLC13 family permease n=1 Tax=Tichowtungia aerotolerans TaxID=2697043 RepID=UPI001E581DD7|nr:SLC13 family permease [Tichowtungia aerotolerans]